MKNPSAKAGRYHLNGLTPSNPLYILQTSPTTYKPYLETYKSLAKELSISLVPGTIVERHSPDTDEEKPLLYNTAYFIAPTGEILGSYRKKNIWHPEREYLTSSGEEPHEVIETPVGKVGLLICWDLAFPEAFRELIAKGAEMVIIPTFCRFSEFVTGVYADMHVQGVDMMRRRRHYSTIPTARSFYLSRRLRRARLRIPVRLSLRMSLVGLGIGISGCRGLCCRLWELSGVWKMRRE